MLGSVFITILHYGQGHLVQKHQNGGNSYIHVKNKNKTWRPRVHSCHCKSKVNQPQILKCGS